ncbi:MAG TPA: FtsX-like permease family protein [Ktedonobacterales bacterium]|nr:FtsX-like permease family protein [Ktedonobacterales bacterium]
MGVETSHTALNDAPEDEAHASDDVWAVAHAGPLTPLALARLRVTRGWRLLLVAGLGMLVAVVLICSVPLYATLVGNVQLQHALATAAPTDTNVEIEVFAIPITNGGLSDITAAVTSDVVPLQPFVAGTGSYLELEQKLPAVAVSPKTEKLPELPRVEPLVFDYATALPHMKVLAGRLPQDAKDGIPEVMVSAKMGLKVGDLLTVGYNAAALSGGKLAVHPLVVRVVGVWFPKSLDDPYWNGRSYDSVRPVVLDGPPQPIDFPLLFSRDDFAATFIPPQAPVAAGAPLIQRLQIVLHEVYLTNTAAITTANADQVQAAVASVKGGAQNILTLEQRTAQPTAIISSVSAGTRLDQIVATVQQQLQLLAQPLYIIVAQVVALALLFVVAMAALLVEAQAGELATLKSRGAGIVQVLTPYVLQGAALAAIAAVVGPVLAAALSLAVVRAYVPGAQALAPGYLAHTVSPQSVTRPALAGAALGALALVVAAWLASRLDVLAFRREQGRGTRVALWRRYYLDLILAGFCVLGYLELGQFGGLDVRAQLGQQSPATGADPFLLAAPGLLLVAGALLVLRLFPLAARLGAALLGRGRGASGVLAFAQVARGSAQFTRLTLLLTLAIGMALFALTFQASLGQNATQKAAFIVGSDQRDILTTQSLTIQTIALLPQMRALPGVTAAMPAYRSHANVNPATGIATAGVLGVDPATFASVVSWRADYADQPLATLMQQMRAHAQGPNAGDRDHPLWALVDRTFASDNFVAPGAIFTLNPAEASDTTTRVYFRVGAVVNYVPTMTDPTVSGNILVDQQDYVTALLNPDLVNSQITGPNEFWLRTTGTSGDDARRAHAIQQSLLPITSVLDRRTLAGSLRFEPINAGMSGLLLAGALIAALLAVLGSLVQAAVAARQRVTQFAILRTLGAGGRQLLGILLSQQLIVFCCGLLGGTLLGLVLATATLPFLQFSTQVANAAVLRLPPYTLVLDPAPVAAFYGALMLACLLALAVSARIATHTGLGKALRIGED